MCTVYSSLCLFFETTNSDAPAISEVEKPTETIVDKEASQWDDEALVAATSTARIALTSNAAELLDMKALESKGQDDIAERMRLEETKAALASAREGMERQAQRLKEEQEKKKEEPSRFAAAAETSAGGKWIPSRLRSGGTSLSRVRMGGTTHQKLDTQDESLFPDLKEADKILQQEKKQEAVYKVPKKTAVGGGATWGSRPAVKKVVPKEEEKLGPPVSTAPAPSAPPTPVAPPSPVAPPTPAAPPTPVAVAPISTEPKPSVGAGLKKKKKKDISTFKPSS